MSPTAPTLRPIVTTSSRTRAGSALLPHFRASGNGAMRFRHGGKVATVITESSKNTSPSFFLIGCCSSYFSFSLLAISSEQRRAKEIHMKRTLKKFLLPKASKLKNITTFQMTLKINPPCGYLIHLCYVKYEISAE